MAESDNVTTLVPGAGRPRGGYRRPMGWWYYAKKAIPLFPGVSNPVSATFLEEHYERRAGRLPLLQKMGNLLTYLGFQAWITYRVREIAKRYGLSHQWRKFALPIARARFTDPDEIALFRIARAEDLDAYMRRFEHSEISRTANPLCWEPECVLANKIEYYAMCELHGVPHPKVYATSLDGKVRVHGVPQPGKIAIKPSGGEGGAGFHSKIYEPDGQPSVADFQKFLERNLKSSRDWVVQKMAETHEDLKEISLSALPTARISTMQNEEGGFEIVTSVFRFPSDPKSEVDNIKSGSFMAPIDLSTGILGVGCRGKGGSLANYAEHPVTGGRIEGLQLPFWKEACEVALDAHSRVFSGYSLVGWDVAFTPDGPILIEGNGKPGMILAQRAPRIGAGETRYGELLAYHLRR